MQAPNVLSEPMLNHPTSVNSCLTPAPPSETQELPAEMNSNGDIEIPEPLDSGGHQPLQAGNPAIFAESLLTEQSVIRTIADDIEIVPATESAPNIDSIQRLSPSIVQNVGMVSSADSFFGVGIIEEEKPVAISISNNNELSSAQSVHIVDSMEPATTVINENIEVAPAAFSESVRGVDGMESEQPVAVSVAESLAESIQVIDSLNIAEDLAQPDQVPCDRKELSCSSKSECETDSDPCLEESDSDTDVTSDEDEGNMISKEDLERFMSKKNVGFLASFEEEEIPRTKNELDPTTVEFPDRHAMLISPNASLHVIGTIVSFVEGVMVIKQNDGVPTVDLDSALALADRVPLGWVDDVIGPVDCPFYLVRLRDDHGIPAELIAPGTLVFAVDDLCQYLKMSTLDTKGTDASHQHDEENPDVVYYSDDEQERNAKKQKKPSRRATGPPVPRIWRSVEDFPGRSSFEANSRQNRHGTQFPSDAFHRSESAYQQEGEGIRPPYQGSTYRRNLYHHISSEQRLDYGQFENSHHLYADRRPYHEHQ